MEQNIVKNKHKSTKHGKHCVYNINYHVVFCTKYRRNFLVGLIESDCKKIITQEAEKVNCKVEIIEVMPNYIQLFVSAIPNISPHTFVKRIKGATSNYLRKEYPQLYSSPALWSSSYYIGSIGSVSESVVKMFIENQKRV